MKKIYSEPQIFIHQLKNRDVITTSDPITHEQIGYGEGAPGREGFDEDEY